MAVICTGYRAGINARRTVCVMLMLAALAFAPASYHHARAAGTHKTLLDTVDWCAKHEFQCQHARVTFHNGSVKRVAYCNPKADALMGVCHADELAVVTVRRWADSKRIPEDVASFEPMRQQ